MKTIIYPVVLMMYLPLSGCSDDHNKSEVLIRANDVHRDSVTIAESLEVNLRALRKRSPDSASLTKIDSLAALIELWESAVSELPGFEYHHDHNRHHDHKPAPDMTDQSMLEYQISAKEAITDVRVQVTNLTKNNK